MKKYYRNRVSLILHYNKPKYPCKNLTTVWWEFAADLPFRTKLARKQEIKFAFKHKKNKKKKHLKATTKVQTLSRKIFLNFKLQHFMHLSQTNAKLLAYLIRFLFSKILLMYGT